MKSKQWIVALAALAACGRPASDGGTGGNAGGGGSGNIDGVSMADMVPCDLYLRCVGAVDAVDRSAETLAYGPKGVCWQADPAQCRAQCQTSLTALQMKHPEATGDCFPPLPAPTSCLGLLQCQTACRTTLWRTDCTHVCSGMATATANQEVNAALLCGGDECSGNKSRPARCTLAFADAAGQPAGACMECLAEATGPLSGDGSCANESSPDCRGGVDCAAEYAPCRAAP